MRKPTSLDRLDKLKHRCMHEIRQLELELKTMRDKYKLLEQITREVVHINRHGITPKKCKL